MLVFSRDGSNLAITRTREKLEVIMNSNSSYPESIVVLVYLKLAVVGKNLVNLYEVVDKSMLPTEYLPDDYTGPNAGPMDKLIGESLTVQPVLAVTSVEQPTCI